MNGLFLTLLLRWVAKSTLDAFPFCIPYKAIIYLSSKSAYSDSIYKFIFSERRDIVYAIVSKFKECLSISKLFYSILSDNLESSPGPLENQR